MPDENAVRPRWADSGSSPSISKFGSPEARSRTRSWRSATSRSGIPRSAWNAPAAGNRARRSSHWLRSRRSGQAQPHNLDFPAIWQTTPNSTLGSCEGTLSGHGFHVLRRCPWTSERGSIPICATSSASFETWPSSLRSSLSSSSGSFPIPRAQSKDENGVGGVRCRSIDSISATARVTSAASSSLKRETTRRPSEWPTVWAVARSASCGATTACSSGGTGEGDWPLHRKTAVSPPRIPPSDAFEARRVFGTHPALDALRGA